MDSAGAQRVGAAFEALLLEQALHPLARECGALGDYGLDLLATAIARHDAHGFGVLLAARLSTNAD